VPGAGAGASVSVVDGPFLTTLHLFRVPLRAAPAALVRMAADRGTLRATAGLHFWKLLGTGDGRTFDLRDADLRTWGLLGVWTDAAALAAFERRSPVAAAWRRIAHERWRADLLLLSAHGRWSGRAPFGAPAHTAHDGPVAALTRARLRPGHLTEFWRAVPPVTADLRDRPGLLLSVGIGEAPVGLQGTFSVWASARALRDFAYRSAPHRAVIRRTHEIGWYAEELFARFAVLQTTGTIFGGDPLAARHGLGGAAPAGARGPRRPSPARQT
jgi:hypothetical protein